MANEKKATPVRCLAEGGVCIALSIALSYLKIPLGAGWGGWGGSVDLVMVPLIVFAVRWGMGWGLCAGLVFGTLKFFLANGTAINWVSIIFDYSLAYAFVGFAGLMKRFDEKEKLWAMPVGAVIGCVCRFVIHFISGVTVYAEYMPEEFMGVTRLTPPLYSLLYNGTYMLPNTVLAVVLCALLAKPMQKLKK